jgi:hypothetical protein
MTGYPFYTARDIYARPATETRPPDDSSAADPSSTTASSVMTAAQRVAERTGPPVISELDLTIEQREQLDQLKKCDQEVRAHEQAHQAVGGPYAGSASFTYQTGPDGQRYAVGGEVSIDLSAIPGDPQATITEMQQIRRAALAPSNPSPADRQVATRAAQVERRARAELNHRRAGGTRTDEPGIGRAQTGYADEISATRLPDASSDSPTEPGILLDMMT